MNKKLVLLVALLSGVPVMAMEHTKEIPSGNEASHYEEESLVKIRLTDSENSQSTHEAHEVEIPVRLAKLIGALNELVEDPKTKDSAFPLRNVTITIWQFIEPQLEHVYGITHDASHAVELRHEIITEHGMLDAKSLIGVICALDYLQIPILLESACEVLKQSALDKISWEELEELPFHIRNQIIMDNVLMLLGPIPAKELAICGVHEHTVTSVCIAEDGKIISGSLDNTVRVWDMQGSRLAECRGHEDLVKSVCVTKDGKILSGSLDKTVRVWDMQGNQLAVCRGHEYGVYSLCVMKDIKIVSGSSDRTVRVWDMEGTQLAVCRGHEHSIWSICVTQDMIVSGSDDGTVRVWDMQGDQLAICRGHERVVYSVYVSEDGKIVSGSFDHTVRVWDMAGNTLAVCRGHGDRVTSVCVAKDGKIISGSNDRTVRVWDMEGNQLAVCKGHEGWVTSICVTNGGKIVSGSWDRTVRLWDMQGNQLAECRGYEYGVNFNSVFCVTKDSKIVSGSQDKTVRVWDIGLLDSIAFMNEDQAQALWAYVRNLPRDVNQQTRWRQIEKILGEDVPVASSNINNNNNE